MTHSRYVNRLSHCTVRSLKFLIYKIRGGSDDLLSVPDPNSFFRWSVGQYCSPNKSSLQVAAWQNVPCGPRSHVSLEFCSLPGTKKTAQRPHLSLSPQFLAHTVSFQPGNPASPIVSARALYLDSNPFSYWGLRLLKANPLYFGVFFVFLLKVGYALLLSVCPPRK